MMTYAVKVGRPSMPLSVVWWPLRHGLGLFLGDLPQVRLPVRLVLMQRLVWLLTPPSIMTLATFLISPMTTVSWGSAR
jgi:hypothetical protein